MEQQGLQELVNNCYEMAEKLLLDQGEFYPLGARIDFNGEFNYSSFHDGEEFPLSTTVVENLKNYFERQLQNKKIRAYAVTYDSKVTSDSFPTPIDAITILIKQFNNDPVLYYFPYSIQDNIIEYFEPWAENTT